MKRVAIGAAAAVTAVGAAVAGQRLVKGGLTKASLGKGGIGSRLAKSAIERSGVEDRWHSVTINRSPEEIRTVPEPLTELGSAVEVRIRPAPGERGTEVAARMREHVPSGMGAFAARLTGDDPVWRVRRALRDAKVGDPIEIETPKGARTFVVQKLVG